MIETESASEILTKIKQADADRTAISNRQDEDESLLIDDYVLRFPDGEVVPNVLPTTSNQPMVDLINTLANLDIAEMHIEIEGDELAEGFGAKLEDFFNDLLLTIDDNMSARFKRHFQSWVDFYICTRGEIAALGIMREEKERFYPDVVPHDTRYTRSKQGRDGPLWMSFEYERDREVILDEYPDADLPSKSSGATASTKYKVLNYWSKIENVILIDGKEAYRQDNPFEKLGNLAVPGLITGSGMGLMFDNADSFKHQNESIFWGNRRIYPIISEMLCIDRNDFVANFRPDTVGVSSIPNEEGPDLDKGEYPWGTGRHTPLSPGGSIQRAIPADNINDRGRLYREFALKQASQAGSHDIDLGNSSRQYSMLQITDFTEKKRKTLKPIFDAKVLFYRSLLSMAVEQMQVLSYSGPIMLGKRGAEKEYKISDIKGRYFIDVRFGGKDPIKDLAAMDQAANLKKLDLVADDYIRRDILEMDEPDNAKRDHRIQQAEMTDDVLRLINLGVAYIEEDNDLEAKVIQARVIPMLKQLAAQGQDKAPAQEAISMARPQPLQQLPQGGAPPRAGTAMPKMTLANLGKPGGK